MTSQPVSVSLKCLNNGHVIGAVFVASKLLLLSWSITLEGGLFIRSDDFDSLLHPVCFLQLSKCIFCQICVSIACQC
jgi:hypothetical protein